MRTKTCLGGFGLLVLCACTSSGLGDVASDADLDAGVIEGGNVGADAQPPLTCPGSKPGAKRVLFGDLHVHTSFSFDAYFFNALNSPKLAYEFAKGGTGQLPCGDAFDTPCRTAKLDAPLDFTAVTDHAEFLGLATLCGAEGQPSQNPALCSAFGTYLRNSVAKMVSGAAPAPPAALAALENATDPADSWARAIAAAEAANNPCSFTSFVAFEHSAQPNGGMLHRNVIFNGKQINVVPISGFEATDEWQLFNRLDAVCPHGQNGIDCDYITIPHNSNLADGLMFQPKPLVGTTEATQAQIEQRAKSDLLVEMTQHKGDSECSRGFLNPLSAEEDVACSFEKVKPICTGAATDSMYCRKECTTPATTVDGGAATPDDCTARLDMVRDALAQGLKLQDSYKGVNPFKLGFIGSTDTHNGTPGHVSEEKWQGHAGIIDDEPKELLGAWQCIDGSSACLPSDRVFDSQAFLFNPGGLAAVWAEENTRDSIFAAMKHREAFATSGPRISIKVYGGWETLPADTCALLQNNQDPVEAAKVAAVPMGGDLVKAPAGKKPQFVVRAVADALVGTPLQRVEIIKGWLDSSGALHTKVFKVEGDNTGPKPDASCVVTKASEPEQLCGLWTDPEFQANQRAFYYARALENPSCRWSTWMCVKAKVDCSQIGKVTGQFLGASAGYEGCCNITRNGSTYSATNKFDTIEERAWGSPIWYEP